MQVPLREKRLLTLAWFDRFSPRSGASGPARKAGVEGLNLLRVGHGGNPEAAQAYFPHQQQWLAGGMLAYGPGSWHLSLNYKPEKPVLDGLHFRLLYVGMVSPGTELPLREVYYNTNCHNLNFVTQLTF